MNDSQVILIGVYFHFSMRYDPHFQPTFSFELRFVLLPLNIVYFCTSETAWQLC
jgi:hypothetical protein